MKNIFKQAGILLAFLCCWQLVFMGLAGIFYPEDRQFDYEITNNNFLNQGNNVLMQFWGNKTDSKRIIIMGSSNALLGIYPSILQEMLPDFTVYNATVMASNITQLKQIFDITRMTTQGSMKGTVYIVGVSFVSMINDNTGYGHIRWKNKQYTSIQMEALRYGLYRLKDDNLEPTLPTFLMPLADKLLRPFLWWHLIFEDAYNDYNNFWIWLRNRHNLKGAILQQVTLDAWKQDLGDIKDYDDDQQINDFILLCQKIEQSGASVVVVDLPVAPWLHEKSEYYKKYISRRLLYLEKLKDIPHLRYFDLDAQLPNLSNSDFTDSVHPTTEKAKLWSRSIGEFIISQRSFLAG